MLNLILPNKLPTVPTLFLIFQNRYDTFIISHKPRRILLKAYTVCYIRCASTILAPPGDERDVIDLPLHPPLF